MATHDLKIWPEYFQEVQKGNKNFEIRKKDRNFKVGDTIFLWEFDPSKKRLTGEFLEATITFITDFEQKENYVVFGIKLFNATT
ncbi:DUF3850 domain-containing protein [Pseudobacillus badius]|uniref:DUF3850 domain-containing protein n=1 Tax=Bacillus badius TaxID=1455 RepID=UPI0007B0B643|nr:DUF3850 domain-containing protein [Bacillus badius]KZN99379.1 RNA-binding protein [Bacillus badius]OCS84968.1 RNA-binding protein [Bacillus badius]OVE49221.1 RNA-binding protein [Bacillus badius]TDW00840.1 uncharacterized protein DUF3850 [Bacillus badius]